MHEKTIYGENRIKSLQEQGVSKLFKLPNFESKCNISAQHAHRY